MGHSFLNGIHGVMVAAIIRPRCSARQRYSIFFIVVDIVELHAEKRWGEKVMNRLSADLRDAMPGVTGLTQRNIYYCKQFYLLFTPILESLPQVGAKLQKGEISTNLGEYLKYLGVITA